MIRSKSFWKFSLVPFLLSSAWAHPHRDTAAKPTEKGTKPIETFATFWNLPSEGDKIVLLLAGNPKPLSLVVSEETMLGGVCCHCQLQMRFKRSEATKRCSICPCGATYAECLCNKRVKGNDWKTMLQMLPPGMGIRLEWREADKPEAGAKMLHLDARRVLLPVTGLSAENEAPLRDLLKPLGGSKVALSEDGKQLQISWKEDWTTEKLVRTEKVLAKLGGKLAFPTPDELQLLQTKEGKERR